MTIPVIDFLFKLAPYSRITIIEYYKCKEMADQDTSPPTITAIKIPIIKKEEYDIWNEATPSGEQSSPPVPKTAKQLAARRNQERIKSILLLAIPDEYLLKFHNVPDAKSLWAIIKSRFRDTLDNAYDRFPETHNQIALIMRNKPDIDEIDIDDLYNNLRFYEDEMKKSLTSSSNTQNLAFLSSKNTNNLMKLVLPVEILGSGRSQGRRPYGDRSNAQTTESSSQALVAQDGLGGYD
ncbi:hypothetical protein Tco_1506422 [Tanacetum coccineum]